jgi:hypothetical protein
MSFGEMPRMRPADRAAYELPLLPAPRLDVYVSAHCFGCAEARRLAAAAALRFPSLAVRVIDIEREPAARPESLVAVPTYLLDGRIVSLGNPRQRDLFRHLELAMTMGVGEGEHEP